MLALVVVWIGLSSLLWFAAPVFALLMIRVFPRLEDQTIAPLSNPPLVSVVIPACNEAETIEPALESLRAQTYSNLEIVLIDDRSTDDTGAIIDRIAQQDSRVVAIHVDRLPTGWLGKVHALQQGVLRATGEWILFADADVRFRADTLERSVGWSVEHAIDHLCLLPRLYSKSPVVELMIGAAMRAITVSQRPWRAVDPDAEESIGGGAFNLVRRSAFERTPGFAWLQLEVADDLALAHMMKKFGGKSGVLSATESVEVEWYGSLGACFRGMEKNAFAQLARFSLWRGFAVAIVGLLFALGPVASFFVPLPWFWSIGAGAFLASFAAAYLMRRLAGIRLWTLALATPLGDLLMAVLLVRASIVGWRRGGLVWRGTLYPSELLRTGSRIKF